MKCAEGRRTPETRIINRWHILNCEQTQLYTSGCYRLGLLLSNRLSSRLYESILLFLAGRFLTFLVNLTSHCIHSCHMSGYIHAFLIYSITNTLHFVLSPNMFISYATKHVAMVSALGYVQLLPAMSNIPDVREESVAQCEHRPDSAQPKLQISLDYNSKHVGKSI